MKMKDVRVWLACPCDTLQTHRFHPNRSDTIRWWLEEGFAYEF